MRVRWLIPRAEVARAKPAISEAKHFLGGGSGRMREADKGFAVVKHYD